MNEDERTNAAIAGLSGSYVTAADRTAIAARFGEATVRAVDAVYDEAMNPPDDWGPGETSMATGLDAMHRRLRSKFPGLDDGAHLRLSSMFMMTWK